MVRRVDNEHCTTVKNELFTAFSYKNLKAFQAIAQKKVVVQDLIFVLFVFLVIGKILKI